MQRERERERESMRDRERGRERERERELEDATGGLLGWYLNDFAHSVWVHYGAHALYSFLVQAVDDVPLK